jgi:methyl-accepting chemotaxis protein
MYVATGYNNYLDDKQLATMERKARISQMMRGGQSKAKVTMQERVVQSLIDEGRANNVAEAYELLQKIDAGDQKMLSSTEERQVEKIMQDAKDAGKPISNLEALDQYYNARRQGSGVTNEERFVQDYLDNNKGATREDATSAYRNLAKTPTQKEVTDVKELRVGLDEMNWLESKPSEMSGTERAKVYRDYISPLEDLRNFKLSTEDKRTVRSLRNLTALGGTAGTELTPDETGLLDSTLNSFKKYIFDEVGGKKATASYETFRNVFRNALYGASLTKPEIESFNKAAGTLGQKFQPVMQQLQVQMSTIKNNLEAIRDLNDPDIAHYYTGQSIEQIDDAIAAIEDRMDNPSLRLKDVAKGQGLKVRKVQKDAKATVPDVNKTVDFDFDAAMKGAGL